MSSTYNPWLICLSVMVAILASYTSLRLASRVADSRGAAGRAWLLLGAISMGVGIWSMHFIGMLALSVPISLRYDIGLTIVSLGIAIATSGFAIRIASRRELEMSRLVVCSFVMGLGIAAMHYTGMEAIAIEPAIGFDPMLAALSVAIAVAASFVALGLTFRLRTDSRRHVWAAHLGASIVMGSAIAGMHYTGMSAVRFQAGSICRSGLLLNNEWLAVCIGIAAFGLLTVTLITGLFDAHLDARARLYAQRMRSANSRLDHQATHDSLTDLPNRTLFLKVLQSHIDAGVLNDNQALLSILLIDIDRFNVINDSLGHGVGDAVLLEVARRLRELTAEAGLAARLGGDEFLLLIPAVDPQTVMQHATRVVRRLGEIYRVNAVELHLSVSIGVTTHPFDRSTPDVLISHADEAMYDAKRDGGNGFRFFVPGTTVFTVERLQLENDLRLAAEQDLLEVHYQPQVDIVTGGIVGLEALVRWKHPERGWLPPNEFIPLAEASDLIVLIGRRVFDAACRQAAVWRAAGFDQLNVAVNLSARQFRQPDLMSMIQQAVQRNALEPRHISIELTETVLMSDAHRSAETLQLLHLAGFPVAMDDFGTGYSSMSYLKRLPVSKLKIDRSFVSDLGASAKSDSIVAAVIALAHGLGMAVIAEGVETAAQLSILSGFGCDQYQGYLFSRPVAADQILKLLQAQAVPIVDVIERGVAAELLEATA